MAKSSFRNLGLEFGEKSVYDTLVDLTTFDATVIMKEA
jgi:hypothetical protein